LTFENFWQPLPIFFYNVDENQRDLAPNNLLFIYLSFWQPLPIFFYDADEIQQDLSPNNRPLQPSNDRTIQVVANLQARINIINQ
jgi:hypothetical protein